MDQEGNVIADWESEGEEYTVSLPAGTYKLHEFKAPDGYALAEDIEFKISETGKLVWGEQTDGTSTSVEIIDNPTYVKIAKQNGYNSNLPGAVLKLSEEVSDDNYQTVAQWTTGDGQKNFSLDSNNALNIFTRYKLEEISVPDGYSKAQDIYFVLNGSGQVIINGELSRKQNGSYTVFGGTPAEDNLIVMNDYKKIVLPGSGSKEELMFILFGCLLFTAGCIYIGRYYIKRRRRLR